MVLAQSSYRLKLAILLVTVVAILLIIANPGYWEKQLAYAFHNAWASLSGQPPAPSPTPAITMEPNLLLVPSLQIQVPIQYVDQADENVFQKALEDGVVHYPNTADIGQFGNPYLFGHSSDYIWSKGKYKTAFTLLPKIKTGDLIIASDKQGHAYTYTVISAFVTSANDTRVLDQHNFKQKLITLQTSYPIGTALQRFIVIGELQK